MPGSDKREQIMLAAERIFANRRFHEVTLDEVAEAAQVGKGTIYRYFPDKDELFFQTAMSGFDDLCQLLRQRVPAEGSFADQLLAACHEIRQFFEKRRQLTRMMQTEEGRVLWLEGKHRDRWLVERQKLIAALAEIFAQGAARGEVRGDVSSDVLAMYMLGMLRTRAHDVVKSGRHDERLEVLLDLFLNGAGRRPRSG